MLNTTQPSLVKARLVANYFEVSLDYLADSEVGKLSDESIGLAKEFENLTGNQKALVKCYFTIIKSGQTV